MMIGTCAVVSRQRNRRQTSIPLIPDSVQSRMMMSGVSPLANWSASSPSEVGLISNRQIERGIASTRKLLARPQQATIALPLPPARFDWTDCA